MLFSGLAIALASVASAAPALNVARDSLGAPPRSQEFTVAFSVSDGEGGKTYLSANAVRNQSSSDASLLIVGERMAVSPGTPAFLNGTSGHTSLNFDLTQSSVPQVPGVYGAIVPEVGDDYGHAFNVVPTLDQQDFGWAANNGSLYHQLQAALDQFFVCDDSLNGAPVQVLRWGSPQSPSVQPPVGCQITDLIQNFNVVGGAKPN